MMKISKEAFKCCSACGGSDLELIADMPQFPHIGIFIDDPKEAEKSPLVDNSLYACSFCGHVQLGYAVDPAFLYTTDFQHKTSESVSAKQANDFLYDFATKICANAKLELVAEVGCNDTFLLQKFAEKGIDVAGVDPIIKGREDKFLDGLPRNLLDKFHVFGDFVENVDFTASVGKSPDLYVTNFVFEHIQDPCAVAEAILDRAKPDAIVIIGVPGAEFLLHNCRFDQLSHQHYQQFTIPSLSHMVERAGGEILDIQCNFTNWGQILIAFKKGPKKTPKSVDVAFTVPQVKASFAAFQDQLDFLKRRVDSLSSKPVYGVGAAQNFPVFAYFYGDDLPFDVILDDHPLRQNKMYPHVPVKIEKPNKLYGGAVGVLSASDYGRVLVGRMTQLGFDHILLPFTSL